MHAGTQCKGLHVSNAGCVFDTMSCTCPAHCPHTQMHIDIRAGAHTRPRAPRSAARRAARGARRRDPRPAARAPQPPWEPRQAPPRATSPPPTARCARPRGGSVRRPRSRAARRPWTRGSHPATPSNESWTAWRRRASTTSTATRQSARRDRATQNYCQSRNFRFENLSCTRHSRTSCLAMLARLRVVRSQAVYTAARALSTSPY